MNFVTIALIAVLGCRSLLILVAGITALLYYVRIRKYIRARTAVLRLRCFNYNSPAAKACAADEVLR